MDRRGPWKLHEPHRQFRRVEWCIAHRGTRIGCHIAAGEPARADADSGQDRGCRTQSNRLIRCRHDCRVVHAHLNVDVSLRRKIRTAIRRRLRQTRRAGEQRDCPCNECVAHEATVRRLVRCLNALEVTGGETLVTRGGLSHLPSVTSEIIPYGRPTPSPVRII